MAATSNLPPEIIKTILLNLPLKSLLRFKTVSKSWNTTISDPIFVRNHHHRSKNSNMHNHFVHEFPFDDEDEFPSQGLPLIKQEDENFQIVRYLKFPKASNHVLCSCDDLLLLGGYTRGQCFTLWNPSTRTYAKLWHNSYCIGSNFGICRDPITDDLKFVIVAHDYYSLYSYKNKSWTKKREPHTVGHELVGSKEAGVCVDGASYWVWRMLKNNVREIVYFDPRYDEFKFLQKPENVDGSKGNIYLVDLRGCLCMYYSNGIDESTVQIWTKGKGIDNSSWKELITVENVPTYISFFRLLCFVENKIVINTYGNGLVVYDPVGMSFEKIKGTEGFEFGLFPFMETMFFPIEKPKPKRMIKR